MSAVVERLRDSSDPEGWLLPDSGLFPEPPRGPAGPPWEESRLRRPEWDRALSLPIRLGNGQEWWFRRPTLRTVVKVDESGRPVSTLRPTGMPAAEAATYADAIDRLYRPGTDADFFGDQVACAITLLRLNYDVPDDAVPDLFWFEPGNEASEATWKAIRELVLGLAPKPSPAG